MRCAWGSLATAGKAAAHLGPSVDVGTLGDEVVEAVAVACVNAWTWPDQGLKSLRVRRLCSTLVGRAAELREARPCPWVRGFVSQSHKSASPRTQARVLWRSQDGPFYMPRLPYMAAHMSADLPSCGEHTP